MNEVTFSIVWSSLLKWNSCITWREWTVSTSNEMLLPQCFVLFRVYWPPLKKKGLNICMQGQNCYVRVKVPLRFSKMCTSALWKGVSSQVLMNSSTSLFVLRQRFLSFSSISFAFPLYSSCLSFLRREHFSCVIRLFSFSRDNCLFFKSSIAEERDEILSSFSCSTSSSFPGDIGDW